MAEMTGSRPVWIQVLHQVSALGEGNRNLESRLDRKETALQRETVGKDPVYLGRIPGSLIPEGRARAAAQGVSLTNFETLVWHSLSAAEEKLGGRLPACPWILSTTKGNIGDWAPGREEEVKLFSSAQKIARIMGLPSALVVSQACVSGMVALLLAQRRIATGREEEILVTGAELVADFILKGFASFHALSPSPCRPFDQHRKGISLGEGAATLLLSARRPKQGGAIALLGGSSTNDANHLSGPSRTGEELALAIERALKEAGTEAGEVDMVSAHGTGTVYNDEMEAKALGILGLENKPIHSLKGLIGHSLGAAGVLETALVMEAMEGGYVLPSLGYRQGGVSYPLAVTEQRREARVRTVLKTGSGFGGVNAALVFRREEALP